MTRRRKRRTGRQCSVILQSMTMTTMGSAIAVMHINRPYPPFYHPHPLRSSTQRMYLLQIMIYFSNHIFLLQIHKRNGSISEYCNRVCLVPCNQFISPCDHRAKVCSHFLNNFRVVNPILLKIEQMAGMHPFACDRGSVVDLAQSSRRHSHFLIRVRIFSRMVNDTRSPTRGRWRRHGHYHRAWDRHAFTGPESN